MPSASLGNGSASVNAEPGAELPDQRVLLRRGSFRARNRSNYETVFGRQGNIQNTPGLMSLRAFPPIPAEGKSECYPPIAGLGVVGDRRTAAVISEDGTVCWFCLPNYSDAPIFGCLLDADSGGYWRLGPASAAVGR